MKSIIPSIISCERFVLQRFGISSQDNESNCGTLSDIGNLCAKHGLCVSRKYYANLNDVRIALEQGSSVIVAIDSGEIEKDNLAEVVEDRFIGEFPDHCVCITALEDDIVAFNPDCGEQRISRNSFVDSWRDSKFYMVTVNRLETVAKAYSPSPLDLGDVAIPESLEALTEAIAENTHEVWSKNRMDEGWTYGAERNDEAKKHPDLLPYSSLTEGEKDFDRATAMNAIKLIVKLGYKIERQ